MSTQTAERPALVSARQPAAGGALARILDAVPSKFDPDIFHVMDRTDDALIADEILNGAKSKDFVYSFKIQGSEVSGISVIGAAQLAYEYGGIQHRLVASLEKKGAMLFVTSFPAEGVPYDYRVVRAHELADEDDFYKVVVEVKNIKRGNSVQIEKTETRLERRRDGSTFERPHYQVIAQSKARRNGILSVIPQDVQARFETDCLKLGNSADITSNVLDEKRAAVLAFATAKGLPLEREPVFKLGMAQITGLSDAAREGLPAFTNACIGIGLLQLAAVDGAESGGKPAAEPRKAAGRGAGKVNAQQGGGEKKTETPHDPETGEVREGGEQKTGQAGQAGTVQGSKAGAGPDEIFKE
jgi:hypothetical protein